MVNSCPVDTTFIVDDRLQLHERKPPLIGLDSVSTCISNVAAKHVNIWLNYITCRYKITDTVNMFKYHNMPLVEPNVPYQNNGYNCGVYCLKYTSILNGVTNWKVITGKYFQGCWKKYQGYYILRIQKTSMT